MLPLDDIRDKLSELKDKCERRPFMTNLVLAKGVTAKAIAKEVVDHIVKRVKNNYSREIAVFYGDLVLNCDNGVYKNLFAQVIGEDVASDGRDWFISKIYNGLNYLKPTEMKKKRPRKEVTEEQLPKVIKRGLAKDYGCKNYAPELPAGETTETQSNKMRRLIRLHTDQDWGQAAQNLFRETYAAQRNDIISTRPLSALGTQFMERWPIFQKGMLVMILTIYL